MSSVPQGGFTEAAEMILRTVIAFKQRIWWFVIIFKDVSVPVWEVPVKERDSISDTPDSSARGRSLSRVLAEANVGGDSQAPLNSGEGACPSSSLAGGSRALLEGPCTVGDSHQHVSLLRAK